MSAPSIISSATLKFDNNTYKVKSMPAGRPRSAEAVDVTCLDDTTVQMAKGAIVTNGTVEVVIAGSIKPEVNAKAALVLTVGGTNVDCGQAVVTSVKPEGIEASGANRELRWSVTFQPCGAAPATGS